MKNGVRQFLRETRMISVSVARKNKRSSVGKLIPHKLCQNDAGYNGQSPQGRGR